MANFIKERAALPVVIVVSRQFYAFLVQRLACSGEDSIRSEIAMYQGLSVYQDAALAIDYKLMYSTRELFHRFKETKVFLGVR